MRARFSTVQVCPRDRDMMLIALAAALAAMSLILMRK